LGGDGGSAKTMDAGHRAMTWPARAIRVEARERRVRVGGIGRARRTGRGARSIDAAKKKSGALFEGGETYRRRWGR